MPLVNTPTLFAPISLALTNGASVFDLSLNEVGASLYFTLGDTPQSGQSSLLDLTNSSATVYLRRRGLQTPIAMSGNIRILPIAGQQTTNQAAYDFQAADLQLLTPGEYVCTVLITLATGQKRVAREIAVVAHAAGT